MLLEPHRDSPKTRNNFQNERNITIAYNATLNHIILVTYWNEGSSVFLMTFMFFELDFPCNFHSNAWRKLHQKDTKMFLHFMFGIENYIRSDSRALLKIKRQILLQCKTFIQISTSFNIHYIKEIYLISSDQNGSLRYEYMLAASSARVPCCKMQTDYASWIMHAG